MAESRRPAQVEDRMSTITAQIPYDMWRAFQIRLLLEDLSMQEWVMAQVRVLLKTALSEVPSHEYGRVARKGIETRQIIARIPNADLRNLRMRLAKMGIPLSLWMYKAIEEYASAIDLDAMDRQIGLHRTARKRAVKSARAQEK